MRVKVTRGKSSSWKKSSNGASYTYFDKEGAEVYKYGTGDLSKATSFEGSVSLMEGCEVSVYGTIDDRPVISRSMKLRLVETALAGEPQPPYWQVNLNATIRGRTHNQVFYWDGALPTKIGISKVAIPWAKELLARKN
jgi:hypothetical protein